MPNSEKNRWQFVIDIIQSGGWDLRYSPKGRPYAALPHGFGKNENGVKLHFFPQNGAVKVVGMIDHTEKTDIHRPFVFVSNHKGVEEAVIKIRDELLPRYKSAYYQARRAFERWLYDHFNENLPPEEE